MKRRHSMQAALCGKFLRMGRGRGPLLEFADLSTEEAVAGASRQMLEARPPEGSSLYWWAHDADSLEWIDAKAAFYLFSDSLRTPMGTGVAAFRTREAATRASQTWPGEILDFAEARAR